MPRKPVIAGNWKMFKTADQTVRFFNQLKPLVAAADHCEMIVCAPYLSVPAAVASAAGSNIQVGAQNLHWEAEGAFTGEVSAGMIAAAGCTHVIIGHSERRQYFGETDETVSKRIAAALGAGLIPIVCVGETIDQREADRTEAVLAEQFEGGLGALGADKFSKIILAYEPVWAIGADRTATPEMAGEAHAFLRAKAAEKFGNDRAEALRILYGGSVKPTNVQALMARDEIDGGLVGGASLEPASFAALVHYNQ